METELVTVLKQAGEVLATQTQEVAAQAILLGRVRSFVLLAILAGFVVGIRRVWEVLQLKIRETKEKVEKSGGAWTHTTGLSDYCGLRAAFVGVVAVMLVPMELMLREALLPWIAPKLYLLEYARSVVR